MNRFVGYNRFRSTVCASQATTAKDMAYDFCKAVFYH